MPSGTTCPRGLSAWRCGTLGMLALTWGLDSCGGDHTSTGAGASGSASGAGMGGASSLSTSSAAATDPTIQLFCGLNTLDGFSTSAPIISENSDPSDAVAQARQARAEQPDDLAANEGGCDRISLRAATMKRNITANQPGIRGIG